MHPLLVASLVIFLEGLAFGILLPLLTPYALQLGGGETWAGFLFAAVSLPRVFSAPAWGVFSDRIGRRGSMLFLSFGCALASILWALCPQLDGVLGTGLAWLLISRLIYGVFAANSVLGMAVASDISAPEKRAASIGVLGAAFGLAISIGPAIGGIFAAQYGHANAGFLTASLQITSAFLILIALRETRPTLSAVTAYADRVRPWLHLATLSRVKLLLIVTITSTIAYAVLFPTFPSLLKDKYGWGIRETGYALSGFGLVGALVQGGMIRPCVRRLGERLTALIGLALLGGGLMGVAACSDEPGFWTSLIIAAVGVGLSVPTITGLLSLCVPAHEQGSIHGLSQSATALGRAVGFAFSGWLYEHYGALNTYEAAGAASLLSLLLLLFLKRAPAHADFENTKPSPTTPM